MASAESPDKPVTDKPPSPHELALQQNVQYISRQLKGSINDMAKYAYSAGLISEETRKPFLSRVTDKMNVPASARAQIMVTLLKDKMDKKFGDAKIIMEYFIEEALEGYPQLQDHLKRELAKYEKKSEPEKWTLQRNSATIGNMLEGGASLNGVANKLRMYLKDDEFSNITDANSQHAEICMSAMLLEIAANIHAEENWTLFIDEVLGEIQPAKFTERLIEKLEKDLKDIQNGEEGMEIDLPEVPVPGQTDQATVKTTEHS